MQRAEQGVAAARLMDALEDDHSAAAHPETGESETPAPTGQLLRRRGAFDQRV
eukprot:COSAG01_NODE_17825_length_1121_cov_1.958904_1_plen_52_part_10